MNYERKYKELAGKIKKAYLYAQTDSTKAVLENLLPELKESKDEQIRKELFDFLTYGIWQSPAIDKVKQSQRYVVWLTWLEKQGEQKPILDFKASNWYVSKVDGKIHDITYNSTDKVEPKFKIGDWIVGANSVFKIISLNNELNCYIAVTPNDEEIKIPYWFDDEQGHICSYHLWTIQDAKDGDVLVCNDNPFLFLKYEKDEYGLVCCSYCGISGNGKFCNTNTKKYWCDIEFVNPATEEQRDLLFSKMKEAGYEWDEEKKELKKSQRMISAKEKEALYDKPAWSEEDNEMVDSIIEDVRYIGDFPDHPTKEENKLYDECLAKAEWLKSLKDRVQPQNTWKPSEEIMKGLNEIINKLAISPVIHEHGYLYDLMVNLRKKLIE